MLVKHLTQDLEIYLDGVLIGVADVIITDDHGKWYGVSTVNGYEKLQDNGEYIYVDGVGVMSISWEK